MVFCFLQEVSIPISVGLYIDVYLVWKESVKLCRPICTVFIYLMPYLRGSHYRPIGLLLEYRNSVLTEIYY